MKKFKLLSIDGGGIRGIIPAIFIKHLEEEINNILDYKKHISEYFDMFAGTSTGAILVALYLSPKKYSTDEVINFYVNYGKFIFNKNFFNRIINFNGLFGPLYDIIYFEKIIEEKFGNLKLSELTKPCIISAYNIEKRYAHFFTQHDAKKNIEYDYYIKEIIKAATAAPTYFTPANIKSLDGKYSYPLVDGGLFANNPTLCGYSEIYEEFKIEPKNMFIFSIGTGKSYEELKYSKAKKWGLVQWIAPIFDIIINSSGDVVDYQLKTIFKAINEENSYKRFNPKFPVDGKEIVKIDNISKKNIKKLVDFSENECKKNKKIIHDIAKIVVENL